MQQIDAGEGEGVYFIGGGGEGGGGEEGGGGLHTENGLIFYEISCFVFFTENVWYAVFACIVVAKNAAGRLTFFFPTYVVAKSNFQ